MPTLYGKINLKRSAFTSRWPQVLPCQNRVRITSDQFVRFHKNEFDGMLCKFDPTENPHPFQLHLQARWNTCVEPLRKGSFKNVQILVGIPVKIVLKGTPTLSRWTLQHGASWCITLQHNRREQWLCHNCCNTESHCNTNKGTVLCNDKHWNTVQHVAT